MIDYKALAERVAQRAIYADNNADPNNKAWAADLRAVVSLLNGMAEAQPVAWVDVADSYEGPYTFRGRELLPAGRHDLYTHPAPAVPQAEPNNQQVWMDSPASAVVSGRDDTQQGPGSIPGTPFISQAEPKREPLSDEPRQTKENLG